VNDTFCSEMPCSLRLAQHAVQMILIRRVKKSHKPTQHNSYPFSMSPYSCSFDGTEISLRKAVSMKNLKVSLAWQILLALVLGILLG
ncbi:hypothetical protein LLE87_34790, partial [Paenibacillus polymyxa]|nr:hypothetical protein [Paenibacillus polymyxa]